MIILSAIEPGIFFLLLWGLLSWFISNKKKNRTDSGEVVTKPKPKEDLFARIQKLQEHLTEGVEIFPSVPQPVEAEEDYLTEEDEYVIEEPEVFELESEDLDKNKVFAFTQDIKVPIHNHDNWLKQNLFHKSELRKFMVLREVLGEPRSLKPYTGDFFQS